MTVCREAQKVIPGQEVGKFPDIPCVSSPSTYDSRGERMRDEGQAVVVSLLEYVDRSFVMLVLSQDLV